MRKPWLSFAASLALLAALAAPAALAPPAHAATYAERSYEIEVRPDGTVEERARIAIRLEDPSDFSRWSQIPVYLDENRTLESLSAFALQPDGKKVEVRRKDLDTAELSGGGAHSSGKVRVATFPVVPVGSVLTVDYTVREKPYFRADRLWLGAEIPTERLRVVIRGGGPAFRWRLDGSREGLEVQESPGGLQVTASALPASDPPELSPGREESGPGLLYAWGPERTWQDVGRWYDELLKPVPRQAEAVRKKARELTAAPGGGTPRESLAALLAYTARQVRYVAVEVGIGGYRPTPPAEVLGLQWGDCKGKAVLLVDLLREAGIEAYPALIFSARSDRIDPDFPSPFQFNHMIVAVRAAGIAQAGDPVAEGLLFVDPTDTTGAIGWLHPGVQDQDALVMLGSGAVLVRTPTRHELEARNLELELTVGADGKAHGKVRLDLSGEWGSSFADAFRSLRDHEAEQAVRRTLSAFLPGVQIDQVEWKDASGDLPSAQVTARVRIPDLVQTGGASGDSLALRLPASGTSPAPGLLQDRALPVVLSPTSDRAVWTIRLPQGRESCRIQGEDVAVANEVGGFQQAVRTESGVLSVERRTELKQRWVEPDGFAGLKEVALAEHRTSKRTIRLECGD
ncbi:MAG TPA: DUF3857 and transglutaminase domain-containing protein [Thermoanaerobaculia bacterium]|nr:DUF3857 and transglutaminase domain-containing protein [Thermoanaerobaculia bacterium]